jgi:hypothetical protein
MDYSKTKIYKIWSPNGDKIYIGSTCKNRLCQRMNEHRCCYKQYKKDKYRNCTTSHLIFDEYGLENCFIELIEAKECNNKDEKNKLEGHYIRTLKCVNKYIPCRTRKEWDNDNRELNKDKKKVYQKKYKDKNKEELNKKRNQKIICECGLIISLSVKYKHINTKKHQNFMETIGP